VHGTRFARSSGTSFEIGPNAASGLLLSLHERVHLLAELPEQGKQVIFESYRIVYRVQLDLISILSVRHTRMQRTDDPGAVGG